jgi:hypothetical protein
MAPRESSCFNRVIDMERSRSFNALAYCFVIAHVRTQVFYLACIDMRGSA